MAEHGLIERDGPVLTITNNNPAARNALTPGYVAALTAGLEQAAADPGVAAVILWGAQGYFCAGGDLNVLIKRRAMSVADRIASIAGLHDAIKAIRACPKPVIAAVEGGAAGAGASIALACDLVVAARDAYFAVSYLRVGLTPDGGATAFLSECAPRQLVNEILMFGDRVPASRLLDLGAINRLTDTGQAWRAAREMGERLFDTGPSALGVAKDLALSARTSDLDTQLDREARAMAAAQGGDEAAEGIAAFLEKRKADFGKFRT